MSLTTWKQEFYPKPMMALLKRALEVCEEGS